LMVRSAYYFEASLQHAALKNSDVSVKRHSRIV
jgi:hypothetical protein